jgi:iron complex transport system substrate-binding protein
MPIVSLVPGVTEICFSLGLGRQLVAVTHECDFPEKASRLPRITRSTIPDHIGSSAEIDRYVKTASAEGTALYDLDVTMLRTLKPDLILTQDLCHVCALPVDDVRAIAATMAPVPEVASIDANTLNDVIESIRTVGRLTERTATADAVVTALQQRIDRIQQQVSRADHRHRVVCLEWLDPPMVAGHWVPELIELAGGVDPLGRAGEPSFEVSWQDVIDAQPETIVLMPCGFDIERAVQEMDRLIRQGVSIPPEIEQTTAVKEGRVCAVDGSSYFSRPGPRLVTGLELLTGILHAELAVSNTPPGSVEPVHLVPSGVR